MPDRIGHIQARTNRLIVILGIAAFSILLSGVFYVFEAFIVDGSTPDTIGESYEFVLLSDSCLCFYVICCGFAFEDLIVNHLRSNVSRSATNTSRKERPVKKSGDMTGTNTASEVRK